MPASSIYSKQINEKRISKLKEFFCSYRQSRTSQKKSTKEGRV
jgi:hypothetical protein